MTSALSGHLVESYYTFHQSRAPFGQPIHSSQLRISGVMSFAPQMHGNFPSNPQFSQQSYDMSAMSGMSAIDTSFMSMSEETGIRIQRLQEQLQKKLGPEFISQRPGPSGGPKLTYAEGWKIINLANEVFGFNGWSSSVVNLNTDFVDFSEETRRYTVGVSAVVRVTLRDGVYHEDVGYGMLENSRSKGAALDKCKKEAVTDAVKRALRNFGNLLGNCLYDKHYTQEVVKIKIPPPKFDKSQLHRRPEFDDSSQAGPSTSTPVTKPPNPPKPIGNVPNASLNSNRSANDGLTYARPSATSTPARPNALPQQNRGNGLSTPAQTPMLRPGQTGTNVPKSFNHIPKAIVPINTPRTNNPRQAAQPAQKPHLSQAARPSAPVPCLQQVSSIKPLKSEANESYALNSEDDAFYAGLDLGEGEMRMHDEIEADIGRPIEADEDVGRAIDSDEGKPNIDGGAAEATSSAEAKTSPGPDRQASASYDNQQRLQQQKSTGFPPNQNHVRFEAIKSAINGQQPQPPPQHSGQQAAPLQKTPSASSGGFSTGAPQGAQNSRSIVKARAPSIGGFNFPPDMSPAGMPSVTMNRQQSSTGLVGVKRSADMMNTSSHGRGPGVGMGLSRVQNETQLVRQPLAPLELEGGDVKRIRR